MRPPTKLLHLYMQPPTKLCMCPPTKLLHVCPHTTMYTYIYMLHFHEDPDERPAKKKYKKNNVKKPASLLFFDDDPVEPPASSHVSSCVPLPEEARNTSPDATYAHSHSGLLPVLLCVCVYVCVCVSLSLCVSLCVSVSVTGSVSVCLHTTERVSWYCYM